MALPCWVAVVALTLFKMTHAGLYLDYSCYYDVNELKPIVESAVDLVNAGKTTWGDVIEPLKKRPSKSDQGLYQAQQELASFLFKDVMADKKAVDKNAPAYKIGQRVLDGASGFGGYMGFAYSAERIKLDEIVAKAQGKTPKPPKLPSDVQVLPLSSYQQKKNVFLYCDFSRFGNLDQDCDGKEYVMTAEEKAAGEVVLCNKSINMMTAMSYWTTQCMVQK